MARELQPLKEFPMPSAQMGNSAIKIRMKEFEDLVNSIPIGKTVFVACNIDENPRGLSLRLSHAARRIPGVQIRTASVSYQGNDGVAVERIQ